jgi:hypothetical protein
MHAVFARAYSLACRCEVAVPRSSLTTRGHPEFAQFVRHAPLYHVRTEVERGDDQLVAATRRDAGEHLVFAVAK